MTKIFIDCGYHLGEGLREFTKKLKIDSTWEVHAFEANPACEIEKKIINHPFPVHYYNKAVWTDDGSVEFNQQHHSLANSPQEHSTHELDGWGSNVTALNSNAPSDTKVTVESIDFSKFTLNLGDNEIYCKMDIEGSEFPVIRQLISTDTLRYIKKLWVEWHVVNLGTETHDTLNYLREEVRKHTELKDWK